MNIFKAFPVAAARRPAVAVRRSTSGTFIQWIFDAVGREPLLHFLIAGAMLFAADAWLLRSDRPTINVDQSTVEYVVSEREKVLMRPLTDSERKEIVSVFVDDEILFREALKLQLEKGADTRKLLTRKMRYLLSEDAPEPNEEQLLQFFDANIERYERAPVIQLQQVFFSGKSEGLRLARNALRTGADVRTLGEKLDLLPREVQRINESELARILGTGAAKTIFALPENNWSEPVYSRHGIHLVRVVERIPGVKPTFEAMRNYVREDWKHQRRLDSGQAKIGVLKKNYEVIVAGERWQ